jgi:hypothetical protein
VAAVTIAEDTEVCIEDIRWEDDLGGGWTVIERNYIDSGRWAEHWEAIVTNADRNEFYKLEYDVDSTEMQDSGPFEFNGGPKFVRVRPVSVMTTTYVAVENDGQ